MRVLWGVIAAGIILWQPVPASATELAGRVMAVADGDTLTLHTATDGRVKIRLAGIDTPETAQPYGMRARQELAALVTGRDVRAVIVDTDRYGRKVAHIYSGDDYINGLLVDRGAAWVYRAYNDDPAMVARETQARAARTGLWALPAEQTMPPWAWRKAARTAANDNVAITRERVAGPTLRDDTARYLAEVTPVTATNERFACRGKRTCGEMESCAEARFYLTQCGVTRLDGDKDGVPCESLCR